MILKINRDLKKSWEMLYLKIITISDRELIGHLNMFKIIYDI